MTQFNEAIARYNRLLESEPYRDLTWADELQAKLQLELGSQSRQMRLSSDPIL